MVFVIHRRNINHCQLYQKGKRTTTELTIAIRFLDISFLVKGSMPSKRRNREPMKSTRIVIDYKIQYDTRLRIGHPHQNQYDGNKTKETVSSLSSVTTYRCCSLWLYQTLFFLVDTTTHIERQNKLAVRHGCLLKSCIVEYRSVFTNNETYGTLIQFLVSTATCVVLIDAQRR